MRTSHISASETVRAVTLIVTGLGAAVGAAVAAGAVVAAAAAVGAALAAVGAAAGADSPPQAASTADPPKTATKLESEPRRVRREPTPRSISSDIFPPKARAVLTTNEGAGRNGFRGC